MLGEVLFQTAGKDLLVGVLSQMEGGMPFLLTVFSQKLGA